MGIYEVLDISTEIGSLITSKATANEIQKLAIEAGYVHHARRWPNESPARPHYN
jgi:type II secretory ATPase GspE/PulE/Tfp pilus assembly ATPase PilB-like protein